MHTHEVLALVHCASLEKGVAKHTHTVPFHRPSIDEQDIAAVVACLRSGWLTTGPRVAEFEAEFARYIGVPHAIAVNSCTAAMHLTLAALGIGPGDEVITTPYTFVATCEAIEYVGARPVFVDVDPVTGNIDLMRIEAAVTPRTRALMPVHLAGYPCDMASLEEFARRHRLFLIDDAAHALESELPEGKIGRFGDATCFSFYATKNITTGEGGMVTCKDADLANAIRRLSLHGLSRDAWKRYSDTGSWYYEVIDRGYKYNLPDMAAALGLSQLRKAEEMWRRRRAIVLQYQQAFSELPQVRIPPSPAEGKHAWHLYLLRLCPDRLRIDRNQFIERLRQRGVHCSVHFIPLHLMPYYQKTYGLRKGDFPNAETLYQRVVSLPLFPSMTDEEVQFVIDNVKEVCEEERAG